MPPGDASVQDEQDAREGFALREPLAAGRLEAALLASQKRLYQFHSSSETTHGFSANGSLLRNVDTTGFPNQHGGFPHFETSCKKGSRSDARVDSV